MTYTPPVPTPEQLLAEAVTALHKLKIGKAAIEVEVDGRKVRYERTDIDKLEGYVSELRNAVAGCRPRVGGIGFFL